jgi:hypothetical protein
MTIAELIEQLQNLDPQTEVLAVYFTAAEFELDGEACTDLAFRSVIKNCADTLWEDADYVLGNAVYSAMGWGDPQPKTACADECVCGGAY